MTQEDFQFYKPCPELQPYVRYYWAFQSNRPLSTLTFPIGCPQMIFHRRTPLYIPELGAAQPAFAISGQANYPSHLHADGQVEMVVAVFQPHALRAFLNLPVSLLHNQEVSGYDLVLESDTGKLPKKPWLTAQGGLVVVDRSAILHIEEHKKEE